MPNLHAEWRIGTVGDAERRRFTLNRVNSGMPVGVNITKAWLTIVIDGGTDITKVLTGTGDTPGTGQIEEDGSGNAGAANPIVRFDLVNADTLKILQVLRVYDAQVLASDGQPYTMENGEVWCEMPERTTATS